MFISKFQVIGIHRKNWIMSSSRDQQFSVKSIIFQSMQSKLDQYESGNLNTMFKDKDFSHHKKKLDHFWGMTH